jgi:hypothetical protein
MERSTMIDQLLNYPDVCGEFIKFSQEAMVSQKGLMINTSISPSKYCSIHELFNEFKIIILSGDRQSNLTKFILADIRYDTKLPIIITDKKCVLKIDSSTILFQDIIKMNAIEFKRLRNQIKKSSNISIYQENIDKNKIKAIFNDLGIDNNKNHTYNKFIQEKTYLLEDIIELSKSLKKTHFNDINNKIFDFGLMPRSLFELKHKMKESIINEKSKESDYDLLILKLNELKLKDLVENQQDITTLFSNRYKEQFLNKTKWFRKLKIQNKI